MVWALKILDTQQFYCVSILLFYDGKVEAPSRWIVSAFINSLLSLLSTIFPLFCADYAVCFCTTKPCNTTPYLVIAKAIKVYHTSPNFELIINCVHKITTHINQTGLAVDRIRRSLKSIHFRVHFSHSHSHLSKWKMKTLVSSHAHTQSKSKTESHAWRENMRKLVKWNRMIFNLSPVLSHQYSHKNKRVNLKFCIVKWRTTRH